MRVDDRPEHPTGGIHRLEGGDDGGGVHGEADRRAVEILPWIELPRQPRFVDRQQTTSLERQRLPKMIDNFPAHLTRQQQPFWRPASWVIRDPGVGSLFVCSH